MTNDSLAKDYLKRCRARLKSIEVLVSEESWADVVRESQEVVELSLKGLLRAHQIEPPRIHDVSDVALQNEVKFSERARRELPEIARISRALRRDRELAFYGSEDLTPSEFYKKEDADLVFASAKRVVEFVAGLI